MGARTRAPVHAEVKCLRSIGSDPWSAILETVRAERHLAAILAADVAGYSRLMGADEEGTLAQLKAHRSGLWNQKIERHRGRIANTAGDSILAEFISIVDAVNCAVAI